MDKVNYQQARRIRKVGFSSIFADQMLYEPTVLGAAKRAASLKLQAKMKGITEKFDPLNIARMMTFGSKFGPSILGKMTGRSKEDIEYFTGRLKPIAVRSGQKVVPVPKDGETLREGRNVSISGINTQLLKIYKFLKTTKESDRRRREVAQNFEEEKQSEADRRHKELLKKLDALMKDSKLSGVSSKSSKSEKVTKETGDDNDYGLLGGLISFLPEALSAIGFTSMVIAAIPAALLGIATYFADQADINDPGLNPFGQAASLGLKFGNWFDKVTGRSEKLKAEQQKRNDERMKHGESWENKNAPADAEQLKKLAPTIQHYEKLYNDAKKPEEKKQIEVALNSVYDQRDALIKKIGGVDAPGERITGKKTATPASAAPAQSKAAETAEVPKPTVKAEPVTSPEPQTKKLNEVIANNIDANLPKEKAEQDVTVSTINAAKKTPSRQTDKLSELAVRNDEPTLLRMIMASTRLV